MENKNYLIRVEVDDEYTVSINKNLTEDEYKLLKTSIAVIQDLASGLIDNFEIELQAPPELLEPIIHLTFIKMIKRYIPKLGEVKEFPLYDVEVECPKCGRRHGKNLSIRFDMHRPHDCYICGTVYKYPKESFYEAYTNYPEIYRKEKENE